ncbi:hypothetical protein RB653_000077 [Dictyostelium firmibasis]|uniref:FNIP repeat-containing protein n=1 Tax=Dictyostelium firmibasis TaxID=79012 RepID=A0AAN7TUR2_9MYCE
MVKGVFGQMMEKLLYYWFKNDFELLNCILILSLKGHFISYNTISNLCKEETNLVEYNGLSNEQFKYLKKKLLILESLYDFKIKDNQIKMEYIEKEFIKINCSLFIVIENNNKIIESLKNDNNLNNTTTIIKPKKKKSNELFKKVWKNIVLKNKILLEVRLYNIHYKTITFPNISSLVQYRYRIYLNDIIIEDDENKETIEQGMIPWGVEKIQFKFNPIFKENSIPESVTHIKFGYSFNKPFNCDMFEGNNNYSNLKSLIFGKSFNQPLEISNDHNENNQKKKIINYKWLTKLENLLNLEFGDSFQQDIKIGQLPNNLTNLVLSKCYQGIIENESLPKSILNNSNSIFKYKFDSDGNKKSILLSNGVNSIPKYVTKLEFDNHFNQVIKYGDIPKNVTSIIFGKEFNSFIEPNSLGSSITSIEFGYRFNQPIIDNQLPIENLKTIKFGNSFNQTIEPYQLSKNLKTLGYGISYNQPIQVGLYLNTSLESLKFGPRFNQQIPLKTLPTTLTYLDMYGWTGPIIPGTFPSSLKSLKFNYYNQPLQTSSLPSLTSLELLEDFNQPININTLPITLKYLKLGRNYSHDLSNSLPKSLTSLDISSTNTKFNIDSLPNLNTITLSNHDFNLINNLDFTIFSNYIKIK